MEKRRLLIAYAHPDDESFGLGALIGRYVAEGIEVYLICATNGDVGTVSPEMLNGYHSVAQLRLAELDKAAEILKFAGVYKLGYKDSGMMHSETSRDPQSLWAIWNSDPAEVTRRVVEVLREVRPQVVITFNKYGGYGHPDHIAIQRATTEAFQRAGDANYNTGQLPYQPQKLYYSSIPAAMIRIGIWRMRLKGQNPRQLGRNKDIDMVAILEHVEPIHTKVNIAGYYDIWEAASAAHASQGGGRGGMVPRWVRKLFGSTQGFTRIYPAAASSTKEHDLFEDVRLELGTPATV